MVKTVGIIGLGQAGRKICINLARHGHSVVILDLNKDLYKDLPENCTPVENAKEMAQKVTHVITALPKPAAVLKCVGGENGLFAGATPGLVWVDASTSDRTQTIALGEEAQKRGIVMLEGTMTGGAVSLANNNMVCLAGGDQDAFEANKWFMAHSIGPVVILVGPIGAAAVAKVASNMLAFLNMAGGVEVMALAKNAGIDLEKMFDAIRASAGNSFAWETVFPLVFNQNFDPEFAMELAVKDMGLGYKLGKELNVPLPLHSVVEQQMQQARLRYGNHSGCYIYPKLYCELANIDLSLNNWKNWSYHIEHVEGSAVVVHENREEK